MPVADALRILLAQPLEELPERIEGEKPGFGPNHPEDPDASGQRFIEDPYVVDPSLARDRGKPSYIVAQGVPDPSRATAAQLREFADRATLDELIEWHERNDPNGSYGRVDDEGDPRDLTQLEEDLRALLREAADDVGEDWRPPAEEPHRDRRGPPQRQEAPFTVSLVHIDEDGQRSSPLGEDPVTYDPAHGELVWFGTVNHGAQAIRDVARDGRGLWINLGDRVALLPQDARRVADWLDEIAGVATRLDAALRGEPVIDRQPDLGQRAHVAVRRLQAECVDREPVSVRLRRAFGPVNRQARFITVDELRAVVTPEMREKWAKVHAVCKRISDQYRVEPWFIGLGILASKEDGERVLFTVRSDAPPRVRETVVDGVPVLIERWEMGWDRNASVERIALDQPRIDTGTGDEPVPQPLTLEPDAEDKTEERLHRMTHMHAFRCVSCRIGLRACRCPVRCPACGGTHLRAEGPAGDKDGLREGGPTHRQYRNWLNNQGTDSDDTLFGAPA